MTDIETQRQRRQNAHDAVAAACRLVHTRTDEWRASTILQGPWRRGLLDEAIAHRNACLTALDNTHDDRLFDSFHEPRVRANAR